MNENIIKIFTWVFGLIFTGIVYYLINTLDSLNYIRESAFLPYIIILISLIFFFFIGQILSKYPIFWYAKIRNSNLKQVLSEVEIKKKEEDIGVLVSKLKQGIFVLSSSNYSEESINYLMTNVGITKEHANKIVLNIKQLKRLKTFSIVLGLFLSVILYFVVSNLSVFVSINNYILIISSLIVFILFVLEGHLITRMPDSFYLNLININKKKVLETHKAIVEKQYEIKNYDLKQKKLLDDVKKATKFLLNQNIGKEAIKNFFSKYDINDKTIDNFINSSQQEINSNENINNNIVLSSKSDSAIKLTLSKIHDSFKQINQIYNQVSSLQKEVSDISERQKKLENMSTLNVSKQVKKLKKESIILDKFKGIEKIKEADISEIKELLDKKSDEYAKLISYLYHLFLPYVEKTSQNDVFSTLVYYGYPYEIIEDVLQKFKDKKVIFGKDKTSGLGDKFVNKINKFYDFFSR